jgi:3-oxoacyl-[acyl-carrier protein] reductase
MRLKDKVAIITGGADGIGKAFVNGFIDEGARVVIADVNRTAAEMLMTSLLKKGKEALAMCTDVSQATDVTNLVEQTLTKFGRIDILVNNAAIYMRVKARIAPIEELSPDEWDRVMAVNVKGVFLCSRAVFPYMKKQGAGKIINIASDLAFAGAANLSHYVASKGAVVSLTKAIALEGGDHNINVNCIAPGSTFSEDPADLTALERRRQFAVKRAIKRAEFPVDLVGSAIFLACADSNFMTGQTLIVNGGWMVH